MTAFVPKVKFAPGVGPFAVQGRPMTAEEQACDCGCMDIPREPLGDTLTYYVEQPTEAAK